MGRVNENRERAPRRGDHISSAHLQSRQDRANKHVVAAHLETDAYRDFKRLAADELRTTDALIHEAVALLFRKYRRRVPAPIVRKLHKLGIT
jgi:hypothetical protein